MMMWTFKKDGRQVMNGERTYVQGSVGVGTTGRLGKLLAGWKFSILRFLERIDARLTNGQRKWLFYVGILSWSCFLLGVLGASVRNPPVSFVLPVVVDSSQVDISMPASDGQALKGSKEINIHSPLKTDRYGAKQSD